jgi:hypothetical protein
MAGYISDCLYVSSAAERYGVQTVTERYRLTQNDDKRVFGGIFDPVSETVQSTMKEHYMACQKIKAWSLAFFLVGIVVPISVSIALWSVSAVVIGLGIGGGVVALVALVTLIFFQIRSTRVYRWVEILNLIRNPASDADGTRLLERLHQLGKLICEFDGYQWKINSLRYHRYAHQFCGTNATDVLVVGLSVGVARMKAMGKGNGESYRVIGNASRLCAVINTQVYLTSSLMAWQIADQMRFGERDPLGSLFLCKNRQLKKGFQNGPNIGSL